MSIKHNAIIHWGKCMPEVRLLAWKALTTDGNKEQVYSSSVLQPCLVAVCSFMDSAYSSIFCIRTLHMTCRAAHLISTMLLHVHVLSHAERAFSV